MALHGAVRTLDQEFEGGGTPALGLNLVHPLPAYTEDPMPQAEVGAEGRVTSQGLQQMLHEFPAGGQEVVRGRRPSHLPQGRCHHRVHQILPRREETHMAPSPDVSPHRCTRFEDEGALPRPKEMGSGGKPHRACPNDSHGEGGNRNRRGGSARDGGGGGGGGGGAEEGGRRRGQVRRHGEVCGDAGRGCGWRMRGSRVQGRGWSEGAHPTVQHVPPVTST